MIAATTGVEAMLSDRTGIVGLLSRIPELARSAADGFSITELGGTSNRNFRIGTSVGQFALRIPLEDPAGFVNRAWEMEAAQFAASVGIGAPLVFADAETGIMLTRWVAGAAPLSAKSLRRDPESLGRAARLLGQLHSSHIVFPRRFDAFAIMDGYRHALHRRGQGGVPWSKQVSAALDRTRDVLLQSPLAEVPSHCDPVPHNFLDDGERMTLIDWEYAGMNDPAWDLAYLALESSFCYKQTEALLRDYGDELIGVGRLRSYQLVAACLGVLWSGLRTTAGEDRAMVGWAMSRLSSAEALAAEG